MKAHRAQHPFVCIECEQRLTPAEFYYGHDCEDGTPIPTQDAPEGKVEA